MGVILGFLSESDAPCVESPDSPSIRIGDPETLLSTDTDNPPSSEFFQNIRSVNVVEVKRTFTCFKKDFARVRNWLVGLDGRALRVNAGQHGKALLAGSFRLVGGISQTPLSPSLATVEATWRGYVLNCNIDVANGISFRQDSATQWSILYNGTAVITVTSHGVGDGTGLLFDAGETVTWPNLPDDVRPNAQKYTDTLPTTAAECERIEDGQYVSLYTKWRAIRLKVNGEVATTWWVRVASNENSVDVTKALKMHRVYYGMTRAEGTGDDANLGNIQGPMDITNSANTRLAVDPVLFGIKTTYSGDGMKKIWAFHPAFSEDDPIEQDSATDAGASGVAANGDDSSYNAAYNVENNGTETTQFSWSGVKYLVSHDNTQNVWAFPAYYGDSNRSKRFTTAPNVYVRMTGYEYTAGEHSVPGAVKLVYSTVPTYTMADVKINPNTNGGNKAQYAVSPSIPISVKVGSETLQKFMTPEVFMAFMEAKINAWLDDNGFSPTFAYDISWTSHDNSWMRKFASMPASPKNPVYADLDALNSQHGFTPTETIQSAVPTLLKVVTLAKKTTNTAATHSFSECGAYSGDDTWTKEEMGGATVTVTYEEVFRRILNGDPADSTWDNSECLGLGMSDDDASPSSFGFYALRQSLTDSDGNEIPAVYESYGLIGYIFTEEDFDRRFTGYGVDESIINLFWREDRNTVALIATNGLGLNQLLTFEKE